MIINLRGTNGSGKSTIVREVMGHLQMHPFFIEKRRRPIGYYSTEPKVWVVGHYETDCGGCDTITSLDNVYDEIHHAVAKGFNVLYEGIMASGEYRRCAELHKTGHDIRVIALDVPIETCLESIQLRRAGRTVGPHPPDSNALHTNSGYTEIQKKPLDPTRTIRRLREVRSMMEHLKACGVPTQWATREEALNICLETLGVKA